MRPFTPANIIQFELAKDIITAQNIINAWGSDGIGQARLSIYLDFVFLILYSWSIYLGCKVSCDFASNEWMKNIGQYLAKIIWFAGSCDFIENTAMLITLNTVNELTVLMAYYFALFKFTIVAVSLVFILLAFLVGVVNKIRK
jgi:hypothetical protein